MHTHEHTRPLTACMNFAFEPLLVVDYAADMVFWFDFFVRTERVSR